MIINLPQSNNPDILDFGFDKNLNRTFPELQESQGILEDKINRIIQPGETVATLIPGLLETEYNGL